MDRERSDAGEASEAWAGRVLAWHNRHPLARRVTRAQVQALGFVDLPYAAAEGAPRRHWRAAFSERFLPPHATRAIARWALKHGEEAAPAPAWPRRLVLLDRTRLPASGQALHLWVGTAAIETLRGSTRVLLAPAPPHAVFGRRLKSVPRVAAAAALAALLVLAVPVTLLRLHRAEPQDDEDDVAVAAVAVAAAPVPSSASATSAAVPAPAASAVPPTPAASAAPTVPPPSADPTSGHVEVPPRPRLDLAARTEARHAVARARAENALRAAERGLPTWALAAPGRRSAGESAGLLPLLRAAGSAAEADCAHAEVLPAGADYRAVCWPFARREDAERARAVLAARGQAADVIEF